jgi:quercetin dioxygenase-like cupin family protein
MLSRRLFSNCVLCAGLGLTATDASGQTQAASGMTRAVLAKTELPGSIYDVVQVMVTLEPGFFLARHTHPGTESSTVLEGGGVLMVKGIPDRILGPDDSFLVPPEVPHALQNKGARMRVAATFTVDRSKPLASPAPE